MPDRRLDHRVHPGSAVELLEESARILCGRPNRLEYARTLAGLGEALSRSGHTDDARAPLTEALALADECDAPALRTAVGRLLTTIGVPASPPSRRANAVNPRQRRTRGHAL